MAKKILFIGLKYCYGKKELGESLNKKAHLDSFIKLGYKTEALWIDEYKKDILNQVILKKANEFLPDLIFFKLFKFEIKIETLQALKTNFFISNWFGDDQWRFDSFSSLYAKYFNACITTDKYSRNKYLSVGQENLILSQHASFENSSNYKFVDYKYDVSFIGAANSYRRWFVKCLINEGIKVTCFGSGWKNGRVSYQQMDEIILHSKINLNISNSVSHDVRYIFSSLKSLYTYMKSILTSGSKNSSQTKARNFEIPVRGGFEITEYVPSLGDYFDLDKHIICYTNLDDATQLIKFYLFNSHEREKIKISSVQFARKNHTYLKRTKDIMDELNKFIGLQK
tara:strand:+ start:21836 stop:22855 length:1020 start_codon:yes stop_codon:yes gene_type:complete